MTQRKEVKRGGLQADGCSIAKLQGKRHYDKVKLVDMGQGARGSLGSHR